MGVQSTHRLAPLTVSVSSVNTKGKSLSAFSADRLERTQTLTFHSGRESRRAKASEPPISPGPKMATVLRGPRKFYSCKGT